MCDWLPCALMVHALQHSMGLRSAANNGHTEVVALLLAAGADPAACDSLGLRWAASKGHVEVVRLMLQVGLNNPKPSCCSRVATARRAARWCGC